MAIRVKKTTQMIKASIGPLKKKKKDQMVQTIKILCETTVTIEQ